MQKNNKNLLTNKLKKMMKTTCGDYVQDFEL